MKPKPIEIILNIALVVLGIISAITAHIAFTFSLFACAILLSFYYLFMYGNDISGSNAIINIAVRYVLHLYPICYIINYIDPDDKGLTAWLVLFILFVILTVIKVIRKDVNKYELLRFYILISLITFADVPFK